MNKYFTALIAAAAVLPYAAMPASAQAILEESYSGLKTSAQEIRVGKAVLPKVGQELIETPPQSIWPLPSATQWYWNEYNEDLNLKQAQAAIAEVRSGYFYSTFLKKGGQITSMAIEVKNKKPIKIIAQLSTDGQPWPVELLLEGQGNTKEFRLVYVPSQDASRKWAAIVLSQNASLQFFFKTEIEARKFIDIFASCCKLAGLTGSTQNKYGFITSDLTSAQADALGKPRIENVLVTDVAFDSQAESAGLQFLDIITEVNGVKVRNFGQFETLFGAVPAGSVAKLSCLTRTEVVEGNQKTYIWKPKSVELTIK